MTDRTILAKILQFLKNVQFLQKNSKYVLYLLNFIFLFNKIY